MGANRFRFLAADKRAAVAPTVALSAFILIGVGGLAFDYSRLVSMDSELQGAADQAALAAASQLDGKDGACARAALAASGLIGNSTRFANDGLGRAVTVANEDLCDRTGAIRFYSQKDKLDTGTLTDTNAKFVEVTVGGRTAFYALTPIVAAISSGGITATAYAGVGSAVCGAVPFFICSPDEPLNNNDPYREVSIAPGTGIAMLEGGQQWGPGNFGFLDQLGKGANGVKEALSGDALYSECSQTANVTSETGQMSSFRASFNLRFDLAPNGNLNSSCPEGPCSPSTNVRKDLVRKANACNWEENPATSANYQQKRYRPTTNAPLATTVTPEIMGQPRDICHSIVPNVCSAGRIGDGVWDRAAYFRSNHPGLDWQNTTGLGPTVTRYGAYLWEASNNALATKVTTGDNTLAAYSTPQAGRCLYPGVAPSISGTDRRRVTAAVVNCRYASATTGLNGKKTIPVAGFVDVFLVEPSFDRKRCDSGSGCNTAITSSNDVYIEIIGASGSGEGGGTGQITRRDTPYLIE
jgi:Flp pilus assembly protein TadG